MSDTRKIERAYVEAGVIPLAEYVARHGEESSMSAQKSVTQAAKDAAAQFISRDDGDFAELEMLFQTYGDHIAAQSEAAAQIAELAEADRFARIVSRVVRCACDATESHRRKDAVIVSTREWHRIMALMQDADALRAALAKHRKGEG